MSTLAPPRLRKRLGAILTMVDAREGILEESAGEVTKQVKAYDQAIENATTETLEALGFFLADEAGEVAAIDKEISRLEAKRKKCHLRHGRAGKMAAELHERVGGEYNLDGAMKCGRFTVIRSRGSFRVDKEDWKGTIGDLPSEWVSWPERPSKRIDGAAVLADMQKMRKDDTDQLAETERIHGFRLVRGEDRVKFE